MACAYPNIDSMRDENTSMFTENINLDAIARKRDDIRLVCVGKTGAGKSAVGNTVLGRKEFRSRAKSKSITEKCKFGETSYLDKNIVFVDTPGIFDTEEEVSNEMRLDEIGRFITLASPGFHAVLMTCAIGRFTKEERNTVEILKQYFGPELMKYLIVVFTYKDQLDDEDEGEISIDEHIEESSEMLKNLIRDCQNRYIAVNNRGSPDEKEVFRKSLLKMVNDTIEENEGRHFHHALFDVSESIMNVRKDEMKKETNRKLHELNQERQKLNDEIETREKDQKGDEKLKYTQEQLKNVEKEIAIERSKDIETEVRKEACSDTKSSIWLTTLLFIIHEMVGEIFGRKTLHETGGILSSPVCPIDPRKNPKADDMINCGEAAYNYLLVAGLQNKVPAGLIQVSKPYDPIWNKKSNKTLDTPHTPEPTPQVSSTTSSNSEVKQRSGGGFNKHLNDQLKF